MNVRSYGSRALAAFFPINLVWVFLSCAVLCVSSTEPACGDGGDDSCCGAVELKIADIAIGSIAATDHCLLIAADPAIAADRYAARFDRSGPFARFGPAVCEALAGFGVDVAPSVADPPPRWRPHDRLPVIRV